MGRKGGSSMVSDAEKVGAIREGDELVTHDYDGFMEQDAYDGSNDSRGLRWSEAAAVAFTHTGR